MKKNMGTADRIVRAVVGVVILALYLNGTVSGTLGILLLVLAAVFVATAIVGFCPAYTLFGFDTSGKR